MTKRFRHIIVNSRLTSHRHLKATGKVNLGDGKVHQYMSNSTSVELNHASGIITMFSALAPNTATSFTVTNNKVKAHSVVMATVQNYTYVSSLATAGPNPMVSVNNISNHSFVISVINSGTNSNTTILQIGFLVC